jgi:hypothetical protein
LKKETKTDKITFEKLTKLKKREKKYFALVKYFLSTNFQMKIYILLLMFHTIFFLLTSFIFEDIYITNKGCVLQIFGAGKFKN